MVVIGDVNIVGWGTRWGNGAEIGILILWELGQRFWNIYSMLLIQKTRKLLLSLAVLVLNDSF